MLTKVKLDLEAYHREGFAVLPGVFSPAELDPLKGAIDRAVDTYARALKAQGKISDLHEELGFERRLAAVLQGTGLALRNWNDVVQSPAVYDFFRHPALLDAIEPIVGSEILFNGDYHLRPKLPESDAIVLPWHQDSQYYGETTRHMLIVTLIVALVDATEENGCLWVIPGSHRWGLLPGFFNNGDRNVRTQEDVEKRGTPIPVPLKAGDAVAFGNLMFHSSKVNRSDHIRWTIDLRYSPSKLSRDAAGASDEERAAYDVRIALMRERLYAPMVVRSRSEPIPTYEQWLADRTAALQNEPGHDPGTHRKRIGGFATVVIGDKLT